MTDMIRARHTVSGVIAEVPREVFEHVVLGKYLEEVGPDAKPFLPEKHRPTAVEDKPAPASPAPHQPTEAKDKDKK